MRVRPPAVAGMFYPGSQEELGAMVDGLLAEVDRQPDVSMQALIAPHAGYIYSGPTAAEGYRMWHGLKVQRVLLIGPAHRVWCSGLAAPTADAFATPLGMVEVDREAVEQLQEARAWVHPEDAAHAWEHSIEVHLPFLQRVLAGTFAIVPLVAGECPPEAIAKVIRPFWHDPESRIVISSDLSHYLPYEEARRKDARTIEKILQGKLPIEPEEACGCVGINGLLSLLTQTSAASALIDYRNSGDTAGSRDAVVGYASIGFWPQ